MTKNTSTPTKPPLKPGTPAWYEHRQDRDGGDPRCRAGTATARAPPCREPQPQLVRWWCPPDSISSTDCGPGRPGRTLPGPLRRIASAGDRGYVSVAAPDGGTSDSGSRVEAASAADAWSGPTFQRHDSPRRPSGQFGNNDPVAGRAHRRSPAAALARGAGPTRTLPVDQPSRKATSAAGSARSRARVRRPRNAQPRRGRRPTAADEVRRSPEQRRGPRSMPSPPSLRWSRRCRWPADGAGRLGSGAPHGAGVRRHGRLLPRAPLDLDGPVRCGRGGQP